MKNISTIIVAKDTPSHINETIASAQELSTEIIILDIGLDQSLRDRLSKIEKVKIIPINEPVPYVELIREKAKAYASSDIILFLDPDEIIPPALAQQLTQHIDQYDVISIPRQNIIFGKWIKYSRWYPDYQIRLFHKDKIVWKTSLHSQPEVHGTEYKIEAKEELSLIHYNYETIDEYFQKALRYAKADAEKMNDITLHSALSKGLSEFMSRFFFQEGYRDGLHGFVLSFLQMMYYPLVFFYVWESKKYEPMSENEILNQSHYFFSNGFWQNSYWQNKVKTNKNIVTKIKLILIRWLTHS